MTATPASDIGPARARRGFWLWAGRVAAALALLLFVLVLAGLAYQAIAAAADRRAFPPPGRLVDIGGYRLHLYCMGTARPGRPIVILESGLASPSPIWRRIQDAVSAKTRICAYDRAGIGWSEPSPNPRDAAHIAAELHALLDRAGLRGPFVLAGHSSGGLYARAFQRLYPSDVSGLVLIDSTPEGYHRKTPTLRAEYRSMQRSFAVVPTLARLGLLRLLPLCAAGLPADFPARAAAQFVALCAATEPWPVEADELQHLDEALPGPARPLTIPLGVLTAGESIRQNESWAPLQDGIALLSDNSLHVVARGASHGSLLVDARDARVGSDLILKLVDVVATGRRLKD